MKVACYCGAVYACDGTPLDHCPQCGEYVDPLSPGLDEELDAILAQPNESTDGPHTPRT